MEAALALAHEQETQRRASSSPDLGRRYGSGDTAVDAPGRLCSRSRAAI